MRQGHEEVLACTSASRGCSAAKGNNRSRTAAYSSRPSSWVGWDKPLGFTLCAPGARPATPDFRGCMLGGIRRISGVVALDQA